MRSFNVCKPISFRVRVSRATGFREPFLSSCADNSLLTKCCIYSVSSYLFMFSLSIYSDVK